MKRKQWVLYSDDFGAYLLIDMENRGAIRPVETIEEATIYDERDCAEIKIRYFNTITGGAWRKVELN